MFNLNPETRVYLALGATDMRRGSDSLSGIVSDYFGRNPLDKALYVFLSRDRSRVKLLHWDGDGYWLHSKRLETSTFRVAITEDGKEELTGVDLSKLLSGMDFRRIKLSKRVERSLSNKEALCY